MVKRLLVLVIGAVVLAACESGSMEASGADKETAPEDVGLIESGRDPYLVNFESADGTELEAAVYPASSDDAPGILLMHWLPGSKRDWGDFITFVQTNAETEYTFMTLDFRGHGGSFGDRSDRPGYIDDGRAALAVFREQAAVDPDRIVHIGASIGSDAAVDSCGKGCVGAVSLSPGSFTGMDYNEALAALGDKPVLCVAAANDGPSPATCEGGASVGLADYTFHIYEGRAHAMDMFDIGDQEPLLNDLLLEWLAENHS